MSEADAFRRRLETDTRRPVYMYQAAFLCQTCGQEAQRELQEAGEVPEGMDPDTGRAEEGRWTDTDAYPCKEHDLGESDGPQACDRCGAFLANDLTGHGASYVRGAVLEALIDQDPEESVAVQAWAPYYDWLDLPPTWVADDPDALQAFRGGYAIGKSLPDHGASPEDVEDLTTNLGHESRWREAWNEGVRWGFEAATEGVGA